MVMAGRIGRLVALAAIGLGLMSLSAHAQISGEPPLTQNGQTLVLGALGQSLTFPLPDWLTAEEGADARAMVETHYVSDDTQALLEIYPKGETQALWHTLYGARVSLGPDRPLTALRSAMMIAYGRTCQPELAGFFQFHADEGEVLAPLGFVCGAYRSPLYADQGTVMVMSFRKTTGGFAVVYQEWRGDAFDPADASSWPVSTEAVQARAAALQSGTTLSAQ
jgi:hypothetical protein